MSTRVALYLHIGTGTDPYTNLAVESALLSTAGEGAVILYLWQNENTVVIGRNQNPWLECRTALLEREGGRLARRQSGGGAVFHDLGNLNFTFLAPHEEFDIARQLTVIQTALAALGIPAEISGRNDLHCQGRKFSGNAFYRGPSAAYHHGTLLVNVDLEKMTRYLSPAKAKLAAKGISSVRSRVVNLAQLRPGLTVEALGRALCRAFAQVYEGSPAPAPAPDPARVALLRARQASWEWNYGQQPPFSLDCRSRFPWGQVQVLLRVEQGVILEAKVYTDAMDVSLSPRVEAALTGCRLAEEDLSRRLSALPWGKDLAALLKEQAL